MSIRILHGSHSTLDVFEGADGRVTWEGTLDGAPVRKVSRFDSRLLVLLAYEATTSPTFENILCFDADGKMMWRAQLPDTHDSYVDFYVGNGVIHGTTWTGFHVSLDPKTGRVLDTRFVK